jgi:hypothetical protein
MGIAPLSDDDKSFINSIKNALDKFTAALQLNRYLSEVSIITELKYTKIHAHFLFVNF